MSASRNIFAALLLAIAMPTLAGEPSKPAARVSPVAIDSADALAALEGIFAAYSNGQAIFIMQLTKEGWKLAGWSGDNIFASLALTAL